MKHDLVAITTDQQQIIVPRALKLACARLARKGLYFTGRMVAGRFEIAKRSAA